MHWIALAAIVAAFTVLQASACAQAHEPQAMDWARFLSRSDMVWRKLPSGWNDGPFVGNGRLGGIFWQKPAGPLHFEVSRSDLYDHRRIDGNYTVLFARCRLPNGHFALSFGDAKPNGTLRLDLWNAEARGEIVSGDQRWQIRCFTSAVDDVIVLEVASAALAVPVLSWHADPSKPTRPVNPPANLKAYPPQVQRQVGDVTVSVQDMPESAEYHTDGQGVGQYATAWAQTVLPGRTIWYISTQISYPGTTAEAEAVRIVQQARAAGIERIESAHRHWWHNYYPRSLISVPDPVVEGFYWVQMYKMASASRKGGPLLDLMGPWFQPTPWPAVWWNLNIQLTYWPFYTANHLDEAEPLIEAVWTNRENLAANAAPHSADSYAVGRATGLDCIQPVGAEVGNLPWTMHNLWLHYRSTMDDRFLCDRLFPLMKGSFRYLRHILIATPDGRLVLPKTASPEYTDAAESCAYTLANIRWLASTIIAADARLKANDPIVAMCQDVLARLEPYPTDDATGFLVGKEMPLAKSHRHWSHLFMIYPFHEYTWDQPEHIDLIERSLNHWTGKPEAFAGYSWLGAASMHAAAGRGDQALQYLQTFLRRSPLPNTHYREWGPVIETPLAFARSLQEMLLTSHGDLIRVFPGVPAVWRDVTFSDLRTEGAFLVSARRADGITQYIRITSLAGERCRIRTGLPGKVSSLSSHPLDIRDIGNGITELTLAKGQSALLFTGAAPAVPSFSPVPLAGPGSRWGGEVPKP